MKNIKTEISRLISSLSAVEKQQFKKRHNSSSDYILLFDYLNEGKSELTSEIINYLKRIGDKKKNYTAGHISVLKTYLRDKILNSLRTIYASKRMNYELLMRVMNVEILMEKGLFQLAIKEIEQAKRKCFECSFPIEKLLLLRSESILLFYKDYEDINYTNIRSLYDERKQHVEQTTLEIDYAYILSNFHFRYFKGEKEKLSFDVDYKLNILENEAQNLDFSTKYLFHWVNAQIAEYAGELDKALIHFEKALQIWKEQAKYIAVYPRMYLGTCVTYLKHVFQQKEVHLKGLAYIDFDELFSQLHQIKVSRDIYIQYEQLFSIARILTLRSENRFDEIAKLSPSILLSARKSESTSAFIIILVYYFVALSYFKLNLFEKANDTLQELNDLEDIELRSNPEVFSLILMLKLSLEYEAQNYRHLKWLIKRFKNQLIPIDLFDDFEVLYMKMMTQLINKKFSSNPTVVFYRFKNRFMDLLERNRYRHDVEYHIFYDWVKEKSITLDK